MKKATIAIIILVMLTTMTLGAEAPTPEDTARTNLQEIEYKKLLLEQHARTQAEIKQELAKRDAANEKKITEYIDGNFAVLDERMNDFVRKATFKLGMVFVSGIVLGGSILILISNQLRRKRAIKKHLTGVGERMVLSGRTLTKIEEQIEDPTGARKDITPPTKPKEPDSEEAAAKKRIEALKQQIAKEQIPTPSKYSDQTIKPMGAQ